ncbi:MAG: acyl-CoA dehydrogenase family protein [Aquincola sp.]|nr:acyl-CoA dehydrogenase family protein [Aquincola sp.]|tara:strand:- start:1617 stop:2684 length:1068 start_codon:yes stop_codon:yes gene_type:complete
MRELFESTIERLLADAATPAVTLAAEGGHWPEALWEAVEASGFAFAAAPEAAGGAGASWDDLFVVLRACGRHGAPVPLPEALLANALLAQCGLQPVGGVLSFSTSRAALQGNTASGVLSDVPWGRHATHVIALCADQPSPTLLLLPTTGVRCTPTLNLAGEPRDTLHLEGVVPLARAPLPAGVPHDVLMLGGALLRSAQTAGALQAVLDMTTGYASERTQFGRPIGAFQAIQHQIAVLAEYTAMASVAAEAACVESNGSAQGGYARLSVAAAKVCSAEAAGVVAAIAHAVHGAIGFTHEHTLHMLTRRLWAWRSEYGSLTHWSQALGSAACAAGSQGLWPAITSGRFEQPTLEAV